MWPGRVTGVYVCYETHINKTDGLIFPKWNIRAPQGQAPEYWNLEFRTLSPGHAYLWGAPLRSSPALPFTAPGTSTLASVMATGQEEARGGSRSLCRSWPCLVIMHLESPRPGTSAQPGATPKGICYSGFCADTCPAQSASSPSELAELTVNTQISVVASQLRCLHYWNSPKSPGCWE